MRLKKRLRLTIFKRHWTLRSRHLWIKIRLKQARLSRTKIWPLERRFVPMRQHWMNYPKERRLLRSIFSNTSRVPCRNSTNKLWMKCCKITRKLWKLRRKGTKKLTLTCSRKTRLIWMLRRSSIAKKLLLGRKRLRAFLNFWKNWVSMKRKATEPLQKDK